MPFSWSWLVSHLVSTRKAMVKRIALPIAFTMSYCHIIFVFTNFVSFTFYLIRYKPKGPQRQSDPAQTVVSHLLLRHWFPVPTWLGHYTSFCCQQAVCWSRQYFIDFPLLLSGSEGSPCQHSQIYLSTVVSYITLYYDAKAVNF